jgi:drug/metabolite transporter (DMT)-like permease
MFGFAANSLLTRGALGADRIDWTSFMLIRLASGAATLALLVRWRARPKTAAGSWMGGVVLAVYAIGFTWAYTVIGAAIGALLLFGAVQVTMIGTGLARGERPARIDWLGVGLAVIGLGVLTAPGVTAPSPLGAASMIVAGVGWGVYSLAGRSSRDPLASTAENFLRATIILIPATGWLLADAHATPAGVGLALASGSLASGVAYTIWYTVLPALAAWRAAVIQLTVPVLTALLAAGLLAEAITPRLLVATSLIASGVVLTVIPIWHRRTG